MKLYIGWDVGGWNCDRNPRSRDALNAICNSPKGIVSIGTPWRGNLRDVLSGENVVERMLGLLSVPSNQVEKVVFAIDTPLAWPAAAVKLLTHGETASVPTDASHNPYLFRRAEMMFAERGKQPLSPVRDMIGSQSLKGLHFLSAARLRPTRLGVWESKDDRPQVCAIECYPSACRRSLLLKQVLRHVSLDSQDQDIADATCAAAVAWLFENRETTLIPPPRDSNLQEGWIWTPSDSFPRRREIRTAGAPASRPPGDAPR